MRDTPITALILHGEDELCDQKKRPSEAKEISKPTIVARKRRARDQVKRRALRKESQTIFLSSVNRL